MVTIDRERLISEKQNNKTSAEGARLPKKATIKRYLQSHPWMRFVLLDSSAGLAKSHIYIYNFKHYTLGKKIEPQQLFRQAPHQVATYSNRMNFFEYEYSNFSLNKFSPDEPLGDTIVVVLFYFFQTCSL